MKFIQLSVLAFFSVFLMACPYESTVPIDNPNKPVEDRLLGKWKSESETYNEYVISKASAEQYAVQQRITTGEVKHYTAHITEVKGASFLNLYSDSTKSYYIYRIRMEQESTNKLTLIPVAQDLNEHFGSSEGLRNFIEKNMNLQRIYDDNDKAEFLKIP